MARPHFAAATHVQGRDDAEHQIHHHEAVACKGACAAVGREQAGGQHGGANEEQHRAADQHRAMRRPMHVVHQAHRGVQELVLAHGVEQPRGRVHACQSAGEHADQRGEIHDHRSSAQTGPGRDVTEGRRTRAQGRRVICHAEHHEVGDRGEKDAGEGPAAKHRQRDIAVRVRGLLRQRRGAFETDEAEYHEGQRREHAAVLEP